MQRSYDLSTLTGLRGVAALWVFVAHVLFMPAYSGGIGDHIEPGMMFATLRFDFVGVDLFIVLSGFLLYRNYRHYFTPRSRGAVIDRFYALRIARIWPLHMLAFGLVALLDMGGIAHPLVGGHEQALMRHWDVTAGLNALMMQSWGILPSASLNEPAWTVSALFFVYVIFPVWIALVQRANRRWMQVAGVIAMLALLEIVPRAVNGLSMTDGFGCLLRAFCLFMAGCFCWRLHEETQWLARRADMAAAACAAALILAINAYVHVSTYPLFFLHLLYAPLMLSLARCTGRVKRFMTCWPLMLLGGASYAFYILHYPYLLAVKYLLGHWAMEAAPPQPVLWLCLALLASGLAALSWLATRGIEQPIYRRARSKLMAKSPLASH